MSAPVLLNFGDRTGGGLALEPQRVQDTKSWNHQLQRAQAAGWFCRADRLPGEARALPTQGDPRLLREAKPGSAPRAAVAFPPAQIRPVAATAPTPGRSSAMAFVPVAGGLDATNPAPVLTETVHSIALVAPGSGRADFDPVRATGSVGEVDEQGPGRAVSFARPEGEAIRVHIEEGLDGLHLWLGIDGVPGETTARAAAIAAELRYACKCSGAQLAVVVCNGVRMSTPTRKDS